MSSLWTMRLFGPLTLTGMGRTITRFRTQKTAALLGHLALHLGRSMSREEALALFWPDDPPDAARNSLSTALSSLRHQLESPGVTPGTVLQADRFSFKLQEAVCTTDVAQFWEALRRAEASAPPNEQQVWRLQAIDLYQGPLLNELYDDWVLREREYLAQQYASALTQVTAHYIAMQQPEVALPLLYQALRHDPLAEATHLLLVRCLLLARQPVLALRHYRETEQQWARTWDHALSLSWAELIAAAAAPEAAGPSPRSAQAHLRVTTLRGDLQQHSDADALATYLLELVQEVRPALRGAAQELWLDVLEHVHDDIRAALRHWHSTGNGRQMLHLAQQMELFWDMHNHYIEGLTWLRQALELHSKSLLSDDDRLLHAKALNAAGGLARSQGDLLAAQAAFQQSYTLWSALPDAHAYFPLGNLGLVAHLLGQEAEAEQFLRTSLTLAQRAQDIGVEAAIRNNLGMTLQAQGRSADAMQMQLASMTLYQTVGNTRGVAKALSNLAHLALHQQDYPYARAYLKRSLELHHELGDHAGVVIAVENLALLLARTAAYADVAWLYGVATQMRQRAGLLALTEEEAREYAEAAQRVQPQVGADGWASAWAAGTAIPPEHLWERLSKIP